MLHKVFEASEKNICFNHFKWIKLCVVAYEYVPDTEEASDSVMSSVDTASPRPLTESDSEMSTLPKEILEEMRKMQQNMEIDIDEVNA